MIPQPQDLEGLSTQSAAQARQPQHGFSARSPTIPTLRSRPGGVVKNQGRSVNQILDLFYVLLVACATPGLRSGDGWKRHGRGGWLERTLDTAARHAWPHRGRFRKASASANPGGKGPASSSRGPFVI
jgi:hypothetical protein